MEVEKSSHLEREDLRRYVMAFAEAEEGSCLHSVNNRYRAAIVNDAENKRPY